MVNKKIVLVTGGASGIGLGTVEYLLEQGNYEVISFSRGVKSVSPLTSMIKATSRVELVSEYSSANFEIRATGILSMQ